MEKTVLKDSKEFKHLLQSGRLSFLIGSGLSAPYLGILGDTEQELEIIRNAEYNNEAERLAAKDNIIKAYFDSCISPNYELRHNLQSGKDFKEVLENYSLLFQNIYRIILLRRNNLLFSKQVNLFTTNVDIFLEKSLESAGLEFNDGFAGTLEPSFNLSNFKKSLYKTSQHYDNKSEVPMFNLFKLHGSVTWRLDGEVIKLDSNLEILKSVRDDIKNYDKFTIINPTKEKLKDTTLDATHYDLLRMFSNELERENSVLFVMGFSFADEHIRKIVIRAIDSNPTLIVYIFAYNHEAKEQIKEYLGYTDKKTPKNNNIKFVIPDECFQNDLTYINTKHFQGLADSLTEENNGEHDHQESALGKAGAGANG